MNDPYDVPQEKIALCCHRAGSLCPLHTLGGWVRISLENGKYKEISPATLQTYLSIVTPTNLCLFPAFELEIDQTKCEPP